MVYHSHQEHHDLFYTQKLKGVVNRLDQLMGDTHCFNVFPDATLKANLLPTGFASVAKTSDAVLMPRLLRDPGCGFALFRIRARKIEDSWQSAMGDLLHDYVNKNRNKAAIVTHSDLEAILHQDINLPLDLINEELNALIDELGNVTNTVEIRVVDEVKDSVLADKHQLESGDLVGFIHTGSSVFPYILQDRFEKSIINDAMESNLFSREDLARGIYGVPLNTLLGRHYAIWQKAAMNFARYNRQIAFQNIKKLLEDDCSVEVELMGDQFHAGIWQKDYDGVPHTVCSRGVQALNDLTLIAGQRESIAALVGADKNVGNFHELMAHGTSCENQHAYDYTRNFTDTERAHYLNLAKNTYYNSEEKLSDCVAHTFNLLAALDYFSQQRIAQTIVTLAPWINVQSQWLIDSEQLEK